MNKFKQIEKSIEQKFVWHPITEPAEELETPVIFLTNKGAMITHNHLKSQYKTIDGEVKTVNTFLGKASYANAIAWCYQKELIPDSLEYVEEDKPKKKRNIKKAKCIVGFNGFFEEGKIYKYTVERSSGRITVKNENGGKIEYPSMQLMERNFEVIINE